MNSTMEDGLILVKPVYAVVFGCILALGLPLNAVSLWILLRRHRLKSPSAVFMVNLAISDLLLVTSLPMRVYVYATGTWPLSTGACMLINMFFRNNIRSSSIFITFISVDRLLAVVYPMRTRHLRTLCNAWKAATLIWLFVLGMSVPESIMLLNRLNRHERATCFETPKSNSQKVISPFDYYQPVLVFTLLAVNIACTAMVSWTLHSHLSDSARVNNKVNVMLIFALNLIMFTVCFLPVSLAIVTMSSSALLPTICVAAVNCCLDPLLYYFSLDAFWKKKEDVNQARQQGTNKIHFSSEGGIEFPM